MKIKNMPERVTKRRAEAYKRATGSFPESYNSSITDTKLCMGRKSRMKVASKFL